MSHEAAQERLKWALIRCVSGPQSRFLVSKRLSIERLLLESVHPESHITFAPYSRSHDPYTEDSVRASAPNIPVHCSAGSLQSTSDRNPTSFHTSTHHVALLELKRTQCTEACNGTRNRTTSAATPINRASAAHRPVAIHNATACAISHEAHRSTARPRLLRSPPTPRTAVAVHTLVNVSRSSRTAGRVRPHPPALHVLPRRL